MRPSLIFICCWFCFPVSHLLGQSEAARGLMEQAKSFQLTYPDSAIYYAQQAYAVAKAAADPWAMAKSKAIEARGKTSQGMDIGGFLSYLQSLDCLNKADTTDAFLCYTVFKNMAVIHHDYGLHRQAVKYYDSGKGSTGTSLKTPS